LLAFADVTESTYSVANIKSEVTWLMEKQTLKFSWEE